MAPRSLAALVVVAFATVSVACESGTPATPPVTAPVSATPTFPTATGPAEIFVAPVGLYDQPDRIGPASRYLLFENGAFTLQFAAAGGGFDWTGHYTRTGVDLALDFDAPSGGGAMKATATRSGDSLSVKYNLVMQLTDFVDGVYLRARE